MKHKRLGDMLISLGVITEEQLLQALDLQKEQKKRLGEVLVDNGIVTEGQLIETLRLQLGVDYIDLTKTDIDPAMAKFVPRNIARKNMIVPVRVVKNSLFLAMADPLNFIAIEEARDTSKKKIIPMIASREAINHAISTLYGNEGAAEAMAEMRAEAGLTDTEPEAVQETDNPLDAPTTRLVNSIIERAATERASDIHFEPTSGDMVVRMRIDGQMHRILTIPSDIMDSVTSRLKIMGRMNIVERRVPQDGRAKLRIKNAEELDMRLSTLPTIYGEKTVIRLLGSEAGMLTRKGIGIPPAENARIDRLLKMNSGVILIVGPTGSGKSSTMYTLLQELLSESTNLITLEDPVEYQIDGATQVQINEKVGLTFASGLRAILRQDPDIVCVGEIRDGETAEIAMRAAMTGHLVISTIHTEDAVSAIARLIDMGVEPFLIASGLRGVISQRLLRRICNNCREEYTPDETILSISGVNVYPGRKFMHGTGCDACFHSGYRGRVGVFELLMINEKLRRAITSSEDVTTLREIASESEFITMQQHADRIVDEGITTVEEIVRTISMDDYDIAFDG